MSRREPPDPELSAESDEGRAAPQRSPEKTIAITPSQIVSISPGRPTPPPPTRPPGASQPRRKLHELRMWLGNVLGSEDFTPDAGRKRRRVRWRTLGILVVAAGLAVGGGLVWRSRPPGAPAGPPTGGSAKSPTAAADGARTSAAMV